MNSTTVVPSHDDGKRGTFRPQLTSLIDVMTILLVFLIKSFSAEGNLITPAPDLTLPESVSKQIPEPIEMVQISEDGILFRDQVVCSTIDIQKGDSLLVHKLYERLHDFTSGTGRENHSIMIQADRELSFDIIKRIMYTCSKAGFDDFSLLVIEEG